MSRPALGDGGRAGFLLPEMLTTFTISAFVLAGLASVSSVLLRAIDRSVASIQETDNLDRTLSAIDHEIETSSRARWAGVEPQPFIFNGDSRRMMFARMETMPDKRRVMRVIALKSEASGARLIRADAPLRAIAAGLGDLHFGAARILYDGGPIIRFAFVPAAKPGEPERRLTIWPIGLAMPAAVIIEAVDPQSQRVITAARAAIHANADIGCLDGGFCGRADKLAGGAGSADRPPLAAARPMVGAF